MPQYSLLLLFIDLKEMIVQFGFFVLWHINLRRLFIKAFLIEEQYSKFLKWSLIIFVI